MQEIPVRFQVGKIPWRRDRLPTKVFLGFPGVSDSKESVCNVGDLGSIPGLGRYPGRGHGNLSKYSCPENARGQRSLASCSPWGHKESDLTWQLSMHTNKWYKGSKVITDRFRKKTSTLYDLESLL